MKSKGYKYKVTKILIILSVIVFVLLITLGIKDFIEWSRSLDSYKPETISILRKYDELRGYDMVIDNKDIDNDIKHVFEDKYISIIEDRDCVYFIYRSSVVAQGVVYAKERKNLVRYKDMEAEEIERNWYYFY